MAQTYSSILATTKLVDSLTPLLNRDDASASNFSGTSFPSTNLLLGMFCFRTDQLKLYQLTALTPTWTLVYDLSTGSMTAAAASAVPWSGVSGKPTTVAGYGISDALKKTGDSATGKINFVASAAGAASINIPHGAAPSAPVNGDVWSTTGGLFTRINGGTFQTAFVNAAETYTAKKTFPAGSASAASMNVPAGSAPTTPVNGDLWASTTQLTYRMNGVSKNVAFWNANSILPVVNGGTGGNSQASAKAALGITDIPAGALMPFAGTSEPSGWFFCDGRWLAVASYPALFDAIGFTYGGDSSANFALPDMRGRVPAGRDNMGGTTAGRLNTLASTTLGAAGGAQTHQLSVTEMPAHAHTFNIGSRDYAGSGGSSANHNAATTGGNSNISTTSQGGNGAHNNVQPTMIVNYIIKT